MIRFLSFLFVYCFIVLSFAISTSAVASYRSFLEYDHNEFNHIRTVTFEPDHSLNPLEIEGNGRIGSIYRDDHKVIVAFSGLLPETGLIKRIAEDIDLGQYPQHEIIISSNNSCSKLALLFAASQLSFSEPHQHKVVLFGVPEFSDRSVYASIRAKIKYKSDVLIFDYYSVCPRNISMYPGLIIEMMPRRKSTRTCIFCFNPMCLLFSRSESVPSERSVQEAFIRFRETYPITSDTPLEEIGILTCMQALRLS